MKSPVVVTIGWSAYMLASGWLIAHSIDSDSQQALPLFGNLRIMAVYCLAALPLLVTLTIAQPRLQSNRTWYVLVCAGLLIVFVLPQLSQLLSHMDAGHVARSIVRWAAALVWCWPLASAIVMYSGQRSSSQVADRFAERVFLASLATIILPSVYAHVQLGRLRESAVGIAGANRLSTELSLWNQVWELNGDQPISGQSLRKHRRELERRFDQLSTAVAQPLPISASLNDVQLRAMQLLSLGHANDAEQMLTAYLHSSQPLEIQHRISLQVLQAVAAKETKQWQQLLKIANELLAQSPADRLAHELLAQAHVGLHEPSEAITVYERLLASLTLTESSSSEPSIDSQAKATVHLQLARLCMDCGRGQRALHHCAEARLCAPNSAAQAASLERTVLQHTCGSSVPIAK